MCSNWIMRHSSCSLAPIQLLASHRSSHRSFHHPYGEVGGSTEGGSQMAAWILPSTKSYSDRNNRRFLQQIPIAASNPSIPERIPASLKESRGRYPSARVCVGQSVKRNQLHFEPNWFRKRRLAILDSAYSVAATIVAVDRGRRSNGQYRCPERKWRNGAVETWTRRSM